MWSAPLGEHPFDDHRFVAGVLRLGLEQDAIGAGRRRRSTRCRSAIDSGAAAAIALGDAARRDDQRLIQQIEQPRRFEHAQPRIQRDRGELASVRAEVDAAAAEQDDRLAPRASSVDWIGPVAVGSASGEQTRRRPGVLIAA